MIKKTLLTVLMLTFSYGAATTTTSPEEQYDRFLTMIKHRDNDAYFSELFPQFEENAQAIRGALSEEYKVTFDEVHAEALKALGVYGNNLTLGLLNSIYEAYSQILEESQGEGRNKIKSRDLIALFQGENFTKNYDHAVVVHEMGLFPYTIVTQTGHFSLEILNDSIAYGVRLLGLPLEKSYYDGISGRSNTFLHHDWAHARNYVKDRSVLIERLKPFRKLLELVKQNPDDKTRALDHFCLFVMEHELNAFSNCDNVFSYEFARKSFVEKRDQFMCLFSLYEGLSGDFTTFMNGDFIIEFGKRYESKMSEIEPARRKNQASSCCVIS